VTTPFHAWRVFVRVRGLGALSSRQLRERARDLLAATDRMDAERASCIVSPARLETAADRGRRRDERRRLGRV
jgi:hypothetical protein